MFDYLLYIIVITFLSSLLYRYLLYSLLSLIKVSNARWSSPFLPWWISWNRYGQNGLHAAKGAHQIFGPIVRLGPRDLSVRCYEDAFDQSMVADLTGQLFLTFSGNTGLIAISPLRQVQSNTSNSKVNSFCSRLKRDHSSKRRRHSIVYTKSALFCSAQMPSLTERIRLRRLIPLLRDRTSSGQLADLLQIIYASYLDYVSAPIFHHLGGSNCLQDEPGLHLWLEHYELRHCKKSFWPQDLPRLYRCLKVIGIDMLPENLYLPKQYLEHRMMGLCDNADANSRFGNSADVRTSVDAAVVYQQLKKAREIYSIGADPQTKRLEIASELLDHICTPIVFLPSSLANTVCSGSARSSRRRLKLRVLLHFTERARTGSSP